MKLRPLLILATVLLLVPQRADAACDDLGSAHLGYGLLVPMPDCAMSLHFDVADQLYWKHREPGTFMRFMAEPGVLFGVGEGSTVQLGPVIGVTGGGMSADFDEGGLDEWQLSPRVRLRIWTNEWLTLEGVLGPTLTFSPDHTGETRTRPGVFAGFGPGIHGFISVFGGAEVISGEFGAEPRYMVGFNITLGGAAAAAAALLYACGEGLC